VTRRDGWLGATSFLVTAVLLALCHQAVLASLVAGL
jgi:hypothetical protein